MAVKSGNRETVSFRLSQAQLQLLDEYCAYYKQVRGELIREAVQIWLNGQLETRPLPEKAGV